jgi:hypothetical protein
MNARSPEVAATLDSLLRAHALHCPALVRGQRQGEHRGEALYVLRCPACGRDIAHIILDPREDRR